MPTPALTPAFTLVLFFPLFPFFLSFNLPFNLSSFYFLYFSKFTMAPEIQNAVNLLTLESLNVTLDR